MCKFNEDKEAVIIRLISNTRKKNRTDNLVAIARDTR